MPSKSQAQFGAIGAKYRRGEISRKVLEHMNKGVHPKSLPKHIGDSSAVAAAVKRRAMLRRTKR